MEALAEDRQYKERYRGTRGVPVAAALANMERYPSIVTRCQRAWCALLRGWGRVKDAPRDLRRFYHRGRHGWDPSDTWSLSTTHAQYMVNVLTEFIRLIEDPTTCAGYPASFMQMDEDGNFAAEQDEAASIAAWLKVLRDIRDGFRASLDYDNRTWWSAGMSTEELIAADRRERKEMLRKRKHAMLLMKEYYDDLWW